MTLDNLELNQRATVASLGGPRAFVRRLLSLGVAPGCSIQVVRRAPLGDPLQVQVGRLQLSIRRSEASHVALQ